MQQINLNLIPGGVKPVIRASQYDSARQFSATIYDGTARYSFPDGATVSFVAKKPDNNLIEIAVADVANPLTVTLTEQACAVSGHTECEFRVRANNTIIATANFTLDVERSPEDGAVISETQVDTFQLLLDQCATEVARAETAALQSESAAAHFVIEDTLSETSENAAQNGIITQALNSKASTDVATTTANGLLSASDKAKLDGIAENATSVTVDTAMSSTSTNPVGNNVVYTELGKKSDISNNVKTQEFSGSLAVTYNNVTSLKVGNLSIPTGYKFVGLVVNEIDTSINSIVTAKLFSSSEVWLTIYSPITYTYNVKVVAYYVRGT